MNHILGIETSCDETSIAVLGPHGEVKANLISSHVELHAPFGGVVPEISSRCHLERLLPLYERALETAGIDPGEIGSIAVTVGPGLSPALIVGIAFAKTLSFCLGVEAFGVNHLQAHVQANFIDDPAPRFPAVCLLASGGHTDLILMKNRGDMEILGTTLDDAAGEAFDKTARRLGLSYPGGPAIQQAAERVEGAPPKLFGLPLRERPGLDFSFSGLKTAVVVFCRNTPGIENDPRERDRVAAAFQETAVEFLVERCRLAAKRSDAKKIYCCGGVAANRLLRARLSETAENMGLAFHVPAFQYCTDNAAMVAAAGHYFRNVVGAKGFPLRPQPSLAVLA